MFSLLTGEDLTTNKDMISNMQFPTEWGKLAVATIDYSNTSIEMMSVVRRYFISWSLLGTL